MRTRRVIEEADLLQFEKNMQRIKVGGGESRLKNLDAGGGSRGTGSRLPVPTSLRARSKSAPSPYRSKWEAAYASKLELEKRAGIVFQYWHEPFSIWLPGKIRYKPDFMVKHAGDPVMEIIEVKGWSKNRRDGITRLKIAAALFPCFVWRMVYKTKGGGWDGQYL